MTGMLIRTAVWLATLWLCLFASAMTLNWPLGWAWFLTYATFVIAAFLVIDHELLRERILPGAGAKRIDMLLATAGAVALYPCTLTAAGWEFRIRGPESSISNGASLAALVLFAVGYVIAFWAMRANPFFSTFVRIQTDRGHHVIKGGPYAWVRHPGYTGTLIAHLAIPIALGSLWAIVPAIVGCVIFVVRTAVEEQILQRELSGYEEYRRQVRWRLLPGVW